MADLSFIACYLLPNEQCRFAAVNHQVLGALGGFARLVMDRQACDDAIQQDTDILIAMEVAEQQERHARWFFHEDGCSCPLCDD